MESLRNVICLRLRETDGSSCEGARGGALMKLACKQMIIQTSDGKKSGILFILYAFVGMIWRTWEVQNTQNQTQNHGKVKPSNAAGTGGREKK